MRRSVLKIFLLFFFFISLAVSGQVYVPVGNSIYSFLDRMDVKGVINYSKVIQPKTRTEIARLLLSMAGSDSLLTPEERSTYKWYRQAYFYELNKKELKTRMTILGIKKDTGNRWQFFEYYDPVFHFVVNPVFGLEINHQYGEYQYRRWNGVNTYFSLGRHWGGQLEFIDNLEKGNYIDRTKAFSAVPGVEVIAGSQNTIEYSRVAGSVNYVSKYVDVSLGKGWNTWGSGYRSQLILSTKAPSFPYIRLDIKPVRWLRFYYVHGFLNSRVPDSSAFYNTQLKKSDSTYVQRVIDRPKFYAAHILEFRIKKRIRLSLGESVVYSDQGPRVGFLVPVLFFRSVDHYYQGSGEMGKGSNSQFFADFNFGLIKKINFYGTLFIDEFSLSRFLKGDFSRNQLGYTVGFNSYGLLVKNFSFRLEYTRILPWVYSNFIQTQTYTNSGYLMGHYIGQNADQIYSKLTYYPLRALSFSLWGEYIRRGGFKDVSNQYKEPPEPFLYGPVRKDFRIGFSASYEVIHDVFFRFNYKFSNITDESDTRTPAYELGKHNFIGISVSYGYF